MAFLYGLPVWPSLGELPEGLRALGQGTLSGPGGAADGNPKRTAMSGGDFPTEHARLAIVESSDRRTPSHSKNSFEMYHFHLLSFHSLSL